VLLETLDVDLIKAGFSIVSGGYFFLAVAGAYTYKDMSVNKK